MREIKFRALNRETNAMIYSEKEPSNEAFWSIIDNWGVEALLMQFTGLKDKSGKEIYEGDILKGYTDNNSKIIGSVEWEKYYDGEYLHSAEGWLVNGDFVSDMLNSTYGHATYDSIEIIGNIYENPELMEDKNGN